MTHEIKISKEAIGLRAKLKNRRVNLFKGENGYVIGFTSLNGREVKRTQIGLTDEAMDKLVAMYFGINDIEVKVTHKPKSEVRDARQ